MVYPALLPLPTDPLSSTASTRLNWLLRRFKWTRPFPWKTKSGFCACAFTFQTRSTFYVVPENGRLYRWDFYAMGLRCYCVRQAEWWTSWRVVAGKTKMQTEGNNIITVGLVTTSRRWLSYCFRRIPYNSGLASVCKDDDDVTRVLSAFLRTLS
jgi:hypothetical protein